MNASASSSGGRGTVDAGQRFPLIHTGKGAQTGRQIHLETSL